MRRRRSTSKSAVAKTAAIRPLTAQVTTEMALTPEQAEHVAEDLAHVGQQQVGRGGGGEDPAHRVEGEVDQRRGEREPGQARRGGRRHGPVVAGRRAARQRRRGGRPAVTARSTAGPLRSRVAGCRAPLLQAVTDSEKDAAQVSAALRGDTAAHRALYDRHRPAVWRVARGFGDFDADDVDDVVQESFVRAFREPGQAEGAGALRPVAAHHRPQPRPVAAGPAPRRRGHGRGALARGRGGRHRGRSRSPIPRPAPSWSWSAGSSPSCRRGRRRRRSTSSTSRGRCRPGRSPTGSGVGKSAITMRLERFRAKVKRRVLAEVARLRGEGS